MRASNESVVISKHINVFLNEYAPIQKTNSEHTLKSYYDAVTLYLGFLETVKGIRPERFCGNCFCSTNIEEWLLWLMNARNCSPETCNVRLASLRVFLKYLAKTDVSYLYLSQEASQIKRKKVKSKKVVGMSKEAVTAILSAPDTTTKTGRRDIVLMTLLYSTAARIDEILSAKTKQMRLDAAKPYITVTGKRGNIRTLYLTSNAVAHLKAYVKEFHGDYPNPDAYLFYSRNGGPTSKMSQAAVTKQLRKHALNAHEICPDVPLGIHAHQIRHAKASHWLEDGMNIVQISFLLGHKQLQTTMIYLDITTEQENEALATIETEKERSIQKKWHNNTSLAAFCGVRSMMK